MYRIRAKICGVTRPEDAALAVGLGADAIGIILYAKSPRLTDLESAQRIRAVVPAFVTLVGVFVDAPVKFVHTIYDSAGLDLVQLHGSETSEYAAELNRPYIKAIRAKSTAQIHQNIAQHPSARAYLLDPYVAGIHGGTGTVLDRDLWPDASKIKQPLILAGGLNPDNISSAVINLKPFAVDINSGVEESPGVKSPLKLRSALQVINDLARKTNA